MSAHFPYTPNPQPPVSIHRLFISPRTLRTWFSLSHLTFFPPHVHSISQSFQPTFIQPMFLSASMIAAHVYSTPSSFHSPIVPPLLLSARNTSTHIQFSSRSFRPIFCNPLLFHPLNTSPIINSDHVHIFPYQFSSRAFHTTLISIHVQLTPQFFHPTFCSPHVHLMPYEFTLRPFHRTTFQSNFTLKDVNSQHVQKPGIFWPSLFPDHYLFTPRFILPVSL